VLKNVEIGNVLLERNNFSIIRGGLLKLTQIPAIQLPQVQLGTGANSILILAFACRGE